MNTEMPAYIDQYGRYIPANTLPPSDLNIHPTIAVKIDELGNNAIIYVQTPTGFERHIANNLGSGWYLNKQVYNNLVAAAKSLVTTPAQ